MISCVLRRLPDVRLSSCPAGGVPTGWVNRLQPSSCPTPRKLSSPPKVKEWQSLGDYGELTAGAQRDGPGKMHPAIRQVHVAICTLHSCPRPLARSCQRGGTQRCPPGQSPGGHLSARRLQPASYLVRDREPQRDL